MQHTLSNVFRPFTLNLRGRLFTAERPLVMGVLNITPDSFYAGSRIQSEASVIEKAGQMLAEGADILDVGGYSSRPGATDVPPAEEAKRVAQAIETICRHYPEAVVSADTFRAYVAAEAIRAGATIINDISAGQADPEIWAVAARMQTPYIAMHMRGTPQTMQQMTDYPDLMAELLGYFAEKLYALRATGVADVVIDPGFGFAKTLAQNYQLLDQLEAFRVLDAPLLAGLSRKSMIYKKLGIEADQAISGTIALNTVALLKGAAILRVHDVKPAAETIRLLFS